MERLALTGGLSGGRMPWVFVIDDRGVPGAYAAGGARVAVVIVGMPSVVMVML
jgi:hypothetical protein